ncbi:MAG: type II toxin-antitoxin system RelE/ParE family toxin [Burkholderiaceae bacterium]|nr:type II toxin-antitoxin system RelE/ParE family toxin [Burkholderiaceae bacterium]
MHRIEISPFAREQIREVVRYYATEASSIIASRFRDEFKSACRFIAENPDAGSLRFSYLLSEMGIRTWSLHRFPFRIFYTKHDRLVRILAVDHERRDVSHQTLKSAKDNSN